MTETAVMIDGEGMMIVEVMMTAAAADTECFAAQQMHTELNADVCDRLFLLFASQQNDRPCAAVPLSQTHTAHRRPHLCA